MQVAGAVPCKRPAVDKTGLSVYPNGAAAAAVQALSQMPPAATFGSAAYMLPGLHGYMPAVTFNGQFPPRL
uniref:RBM38 n=1 Tax=Syphacia muris TaxID=451379 RepID=A0A0N5ABK7_9BILA